MIVSKKHAGRQIKNAVIWGWVWMLWLGLTAPIGAEPVVEPPLPSLSSGFSRTLQKVTGVTWIGTWIAEAYAEQALGKVLSGSFDVDIKAFSATDLRHGIAKQVTFKGENLVIDKSFRISRVVARTERDTPVWVDLKSGRLQRPITVAVTVELSQADLTHNLAAKPLQEKLQHIRVAMAQLGDQTLVIHQPQATLQPQGMTFHALLGIADQPLEKAIPLGLTMGFTPQPQQGQVSVETLHFERIPGVDADLNTVASYAKPIVSQFLNTRKWVPKDKAQLQFERVTFSPAGMTLQGELRVLAVDF